jgi:hypothetical protein
VSWHKLGTAGETPERVADDSMAAALDAGDAGGWVLSLVDPHTVRAVGRAGGTVRHYRHRCDGCGRDTDTGHAAGCPVLTVECEGCGAVPGEPCRPGCLSTTGDPFPTG